MSKIQVKDLYKIYGDCSQYALKLAKAGVTRERIFEQIGATIAISGSTFTVKKNEIFVIMGSSGCGKSTLLRSINGLISPTAGKIYVEGKNIAKISEKALRHIRRFHISMVFQQFSLLPHRTVADNIALGIEIQGLPLVTQSQRIEKAINLVGLKGNEMKAIQDLSGGMRQRVGLARALATNSDILLMDEAFSALDPLLRIQLQDELIGIQKKTNKSIIFITHDLDEALKLGSSIAIMRDGKIIQIGTPEEILTNPANEYVNSFTKHVDRSRIITAYSILQKIETAFIQETIHIATKRMQRNNFSNLFIIDDNGCFCGYITMKDILKLNKQQLKYRTIASVIKKSIKTTLPETSIKKLVSCFT